MVKVPGRLSGTQKVTPSGKLKTMVMALVEVLLRMASAFSYALPCGGHRWCLTPRA